MNTSAHSAPHLFDPARLGQAVRTLRRCRHLGQAEFGAKVGMSAAAICNLEKGRHAPSLPTLCRVADGLGVTANELLYPRCHLDAEGGIAERAGAADRDAVRENGNVFLVLGDGFNPEKQLFRLAVELAKIHLFTANRCEPVVQTQATRRFATTFASRSLMPEEVGALDPDLRQTFKTRIHAHYAATGFGEPDSSRRVLSRNGRFGDLLLRAQHLDPAPEELAALAARAEGGPESF